MNTLETLQLILNKGNVALATPQQLYTLSNNIRQSAEKHYCDYAHPNSRKDCLRLSSIGHHPWHQVSMWPSIQQELGIKPEPVTEKLEAMFFWGTLFENWFEFTLERLWWEIVRPVQDEQIEVDFCGVKGHVDILAREPQTKKLYLFETKTMSSYRAKQWDRVKDDYPHYQTQLSCYKAGIEKLMGETVTPVFAIFSMDERQTYIHGMDEQDIDYFKHRAEVNIRTLKKVKDLATALKYLDMPCGEPILYHRQPVEGGWLTVPKCLKYTPIEMLEKLYVIENKTIKVGNKLKEFKIIGQGEETWRLRI
jgi:hypothetical protein